MKLIYPIDVAVPNMREVQRTPERTRTEIRRGEGKKEIIVYKQLSLVITLKLYLPAAFSLPAYVIIIFSYRYNEYNITCLTFCRPFCCLNLTTRLLQVHKHCIFTCPIKAALLQFNSCVSTAGRVYNLVVNSLFINRCPTSLFSSRRVADSQLIIADVSSSRQRL